jgi:dTMP kinase
MNGLFFSFDGGDGVGKTTQMELFCQWLGERGGNVAACRDPGSTRLGEAIREILLGRHDLEIHRRAEMLLYMAARAQLVEEVIRPALQQGKTAICDRFLLANVVYQGYGGGLDVETLWRVGEIAVGGVMPHRIFLLDLPVEEAARRITRQLDRMERQGTEFHARVRQGFLNEAARRKEIIVIDASRPVAAVQADIRRAAEPLLSRVQDSGFRVQDVSDPSKNDSNPLPPEPRTLNPEP